MNKTSFRRETASTFQWWSDRAWWWEIHLGRRANYSPSDMRGGRTATCALGLYLWLTIRKEYCVPFNVFFFSFLWTYLMLCNFLVFLNALIDLLFWFNRMWTTITHLYWLKKFNGWIVFWIDKVVVLSISNSYCSSVPSVGLGPTTAIYYTSNSGSTSNRPHLAYCRGVFNNEIAQGYSCHSHSTCEYAYQIIYIVICDYSLVCS